jgi:hypothetical protein
LTLGFVGGAFVGDQMHRECGGPPAALAIIQVATLSADISTIRTRRIKECGKLRERATESSCSRSAALTLTTVLGLPIGQHHTKFA